MSPSEDCTEPSSGQAACGVGKPVRIHLFLFTPAPSVKKRRLQTATRMGGDGTLERLMFAVMRSAHSRTPKRLFLF
jgi:hypothetical protein